MGFSPPFPISLRHERIIPSREILHIGEPPELLLHGLGENYSKIPKPIRILNETTVIEGVLLGLPDCTGVSTGVTLVNSWSKLEVSVADWMEGLNGGGMRLL